MNDDVNVAPEQEFDQTWGANRQIANSDDAELDRLSKEMGIDQNAPAPLPSFWQNLVEGGKNIVKGAGVAAENIGAGIKALPGVARGVGEGIIKGRNAVIGHPQQAAAGVGDVLSNVTNAGVEALHAFDSWTKGNGFTWKDLNAEDKVDLGGYIASAPENDDEKRARHAGKFVAQMAAFVGSSVATGGAATAAGAGALGATAATTAAGGAVSFLAFDPHEEGLSDLLQKNPDLRNVVTDYFSVHKDDTALDGRVKNALGGMLGDVLGSAFFHTIKVVKLRRIGEAASEATAIAGEKAGAGAAVEQGVEQGAAKTTAAEAGASAKELPPLGNAETKNADGIPKAGQAAPDVSNQGKGPVIQKTVEKNAEANPDLVQGQIQAYAERINVDKYNNPETAKLLSSTEAATDDIMAKSMTREKQVAAAKTRLKDPAYLKDLYLTRQGDKSDAVDVIASAIVRDFHLENFINKGLEIDSLAAKGLSEVEHTRLLAEQAGDLLSFQKWGSIAEGKGSVAGQALEAVKGSAQGFEGSVFRDMQTNKDLYADDMVKFAQGDKEAAKRINRQLKKAAENPQGFVDFKERFARDFPTMAKAGKVINTIQSYVVEGLLSNIRKTHLLTNMPSQGIKIAEEALGYRYANAVGKATVKEIQVGEKALMKKFKVNNVEALESLPEAVDALAKLRKEYIPSRKELIEAFSPNPNKLLTSKEFDAIPAEEIGKFRKYMNLRAANPDIAKKLNGMATEGIYEGITKDVLQLNWLAKDGRFVPNASSKFGGLSRTISADELIKMDYWARLKVIGSQVGNAAKKGKPFSTMMSLEDAMMGSVSGAMERHVSAARFAEANGVDELSKKALYESALKDPPTWMRKEIVKMMETTNFTTEITKESNPFLHYVKKAVESNPVTRAFAPFTTVAINGISQAMERLPSETLATLFSARFRNNISAGGLLRDQALGRVMLGQHISVIGAGMASAGVLVGGGPKNPTAAIAWKNAHPGIEPYSLHVPGTNMYLPLRAFEGLGRVFKFSADMYEMATYIPESKKQEYDDLMLTGLGMIADQISPDFLIDENGKLSEFLKDPTADQAKKYLVQKFANVPVASGLLRDMRQHTNLYTLGMVQGDNAKRKIDANKTDDVPDFLELIVNNFKNQIPGLSDSLPPQRNIWGDELTYHVPGTGPENTSPIAYSAAKDQVVEKEIVRLGMSGPLFHQDPPEGDRHLMLSMPRKVITMDGVSIQLTPAQYDDFVMLSSGNYKPAARAGFMGESEAGKMSENSLRVQLSEMIKDPSWNQSPDKIKKQSISEIVRMRRQEAKDILFQIHPDIQLRHQLGALDQEKASTDDVSAHEAIEGEKKRLVNSYRGPHL